MAVPFRSADCDPGLGAGIGSSAVNGVRTELKWLSQGPQEEVPVLAGPAGGASHQAAWCPPCYDRDGPDVVFLQPASLCCPVYPYLNTCGSSLHLQTEMASLGCGEHPHFFSSASPSPDPSAYGAVLESFPFMHKSHCFPRSFRKPHRG